MIFLPKNRSCVFKLPYLLLSIILGVSLACSFRQTAPKAKLRFYLPECVIIQADPTKGDPDLEAYKAVFSAAAINCRIKPAAVLDSLHVSESHLILVIPMHTARTLTPPRISYVLGLVEDGAILVSEGITPLSEKLGFLGKKPVPVRRLEEVEYPDIEILWEKKEQVAPLQPPYGAIVLNRDRDHGAPMACLLPRGRGNCLLLAAELDNSKGEGYARFPYFIHELRRAGVSFPFRSEWLSAFFDYAYHLTDNPDNLAATWKGSGIGALHVGAWDFYDSHPKADSYLRKLIDSCHRNGILVYAWLELPHVSDEFWTKHPQWREKTATGRDAHVDWRYVMNLTDPECFRSVAAGLERLCRQFDWDGINLAELYFDSPSGVAAPEDFTPLNTIVRTEFKRRAGIDPADFFKKESPFYWRKGTPWWKKFVDYRVKLEKDLNERFIELFRGFRKSFKPYLDIVVTYVDNIYDPSMREAVGADVNLMFGLLDRYDFTLVLEDPGTVWHLGPRRYAELARTYSTMTRHAGRLGIDVNIVDRDMKAYPTQKQTGTEFLELFYQAGRNFQTVLAYSENTVLRQDADLVSCALAPDIRGEIDSQGVRLQAAAPFVYRSGLKQSEFYVDGNPWPCVDGGDVYLPGGAHSISTGDDPGVHPPHLVRLNGSLLGARYAERGTIEFSYSSRQRAIAIFSRTPESLAVDDGIPAKAQTVQAMLPPGSHKVHAAF